MIQIGSSQKPAMYICAFRGRRDYYQVPLALGEADMLDQFITDAYAMPLLRKIEGMLPTHFAEKVRFRYDSRLPDSRVRCLWRTTLLEHTRHRLGFTPWETFAKLDSEFSLAAAARARKSRGSLFLYTPYAWEAFTARYSHSPRKVLFQFHPHPDIERRILLEDSSVYQFFHHSYEDEMGERVSDDLKRRNRDSWRHADLILCASSFTKWSLVEVGANPDLCKIVPYGIDFDDEAAPPAVSNSFHVLFVGSGTQRKGLHHLLLAWQKAALPADSQLTLVCRFLDPGLESLIKQTPRTRLLRGLGLFELNELFRTSSLFVMPSLVEGFGQVYLEALAQGCPVLGTSHSCLPDLDDFSGSITQVQPGRIDQLIAQIESLSRFIPGNSDIKKQARACAREWPWGQFREGVRSALHSL
jgi:glycosyltransferase involved in cell wall biosynthesis